MINHKINELFETINNSPEYLEYQKIKSILESDNNILNLIEEIKKLQQESVNLEFKNDPKYKEIDMVIEKKVKILNDNPTYQQYLIRIEEFNDILTNSSKLLQDYVNDKV